MEFSSILYMWVSLLIFFLNAAFLLFYFSHLSISVLPYSAVEGWMLLWLLERKGHAAGASQVIQNCHMRLIIDIAHCGIQRLKCRVETISES